MASQLIRIVVGLALVVTAIILFNRNRTRIGEGGAVTVYGMEAGTTSMMPVVYAGVGIVGGLILAAGVRGLLRGGK